MERDSWQYLVDAATIALPLVAILVTVAAYLLTYLRRPSLSIEVDQERIHSHLEGAASDWPHIRLLVSNKGWRRAAHEAEVIVAGYRKMDEPVTAMVSLGTPTLGWPSAMAVDRRLTIHPGMSRPFDFGSLYPARRDSTSGRLLGRSGQFPQVTTIQEGGAWQFRLGIELTIANYREFIPPGSWIVRLVVGASDGSASTHDAYFTFKGDEPDPRRALDYLLDHLRIIDV